ncbi:MAG TPA: NUDIX domain-containing protein [Bacteroidales bacterium]|jgi:predicted NUDIX family NTP pyrophosphohydrolase|nr:NUDIX domain-containing protein [Bacteroidales bacterium]
MKKSAGILVYRKKGKEIEYLLVHPGGPFYRNKDLNSWSIPKGEYDDTEDAFEAAKREFFEETGIRIEGDFIGLKPVRQNGGKAVITWAVEADIDTSKIKSNTFELEWPPKSGKYQKFPEIDRAEWFNYEEAKKKVLKGQIPVIDELSGML